MKRVYCSRLVKQGNVNKIYKQARKSLNNSYFILSGTYGDSGKLATRRKFRWFSFRSELIADINPTSIWN